MDDGNGNVYCRYFHLIKIISARFVYFHLSPISSLFQHGGRSCLLWFRRNSIIIIRQKPLSQKTCTPYITLRSSLHEQTILIHINSRIGESVVKHKPLKPVVTCLCFPFISCLPGVTHGVGGLWYYWFLCYSKLKTTKQQIFTNLSSEHPIVLFSPLAQQKDLHHNFNSCSRTSLL